MSLHSLSPHCQSQPLFSEPWRPPVWTQLEASGVSILSTNCPRTRVLCLNPESSSQCHVLELWSLWASVYHIRSGVVRASLSLSDFRALLSSSKSGCHSLLSAVLLSTAELCAHPPYYRLLPWPSCFWSCSRYHRGHCAEARGRIWPVSTGFLSSGGGKQWNSVSRPPKGLLTKIPIYAISMGSLAFLHICKV